MKTYSLKTKDISRSWHLLDASELPLGRLSTEAAKLLMGKGKPTFTHHIDGGDHVVIINAQQLVLTGSKDQNKAYYRHSGHPGGLHKRSLDQQKQIDPKKIIQTAVRGMLPANKLRAERLKRLKIYEGEEHRHSAQNPVKMSLRAGEKA